MAKAQLIEAKDPNEWLNQLFRSAFEMGASDIFLDVIKNASGGVTQVDAQLRIDDNMVSFTPYDDRRASEIPNAIKGKATIGTGQMIEPGEGRYRYDYHTQRDGADFIEPHDIRVTAYPCATGEFISMRIPPTGPLRRLHQLGLSKSNYHRLGQLLAKPGGLTMLAGPMGSGKTTTLYAAVMEMGGSTKSIITVEDPKERTLPGARQLEINNNAAEGNGMTYAKVLKSLLRVVMDVLLVGEIRDRETSEAAVRIATAGARVFSSIHADDPVTAIAKLISYTGQSPVNVMSGISGVASQRMIRKLCDTCRGEKCEACLGLGFKGKLPVHEVLVNSPVITEAFINEMQLSEIQALASNEGMRSFHEDADRLLHAGVTTEAEIRDRIGFDLRQLARQAAEEKAEARRRQEERARQEALQAQQRMESRPTVAPQPVPQPQPTVQAQPQVPQVQAQQRPPATPAVQPPGPPQQLRSRPNQQPPAPQQRTA